MPDGVRAAGKMTLDRSSEQYKIVLHAQRKQAMVGAGKRGVEISRYHEHISPEDFVDSFWRRS